MNDQVREVIEEVLREIFDDDSIEVVSVEHSVDDDGDHFLKIWATFDAAETSFNGDKAVTVVRHMRPRLEAIGETAFPILSYTTPARWAAGL